jgi:hypothetical protein
MNDGPCAAPAPRRSCQSCSTLERAHSRSTPRLPDSGLHTCHARTGQDRTGSRRRSVSQPASNGLHSHTAAGGSCVCETGWSPHLAPLSVRLLHVGPVAVVLQHAPLLECEALSKLVRAPHPLRGGFIRRSCPRGRELLRPARRRQRLRVVHGTGAARGGVWRQHTRAQRGEVVEAVARTPRVDRGEGLGAGGRRYRRPAATPRCHRRVGQAQARQPQRGAFGCDPLAVPRCLQHEKYGEHLAHGRERCGEGRHSRQATADSAPLCVWAYGVAAPSRMAALAACMRRRRQQRVSCMCPESPSTPPSSPHAPVSPTVTRRH